MPGFLEDLDYDGSHRIELGKGYWIDVKKCLTSAEYQKVQNFLGQGRQPVKVGGDGTQMITVDVYAAQCEMLNRSITAWNLTGPDGAEWPLEPEKERRASITRLPMAVVIKVYQECDKLNGPRKGADAVRFPDEPVGGDPDGDGGPADPAAVPEGAGDVAEVWGGE